MEVVLQSQARDEEKAAGPVLTLYALQCGIPC